jgi:signal transduction histidine kinase/DNA-binding response OmpR family regulator/CHASE3 domain sensor protein
LTTSGLLFAAGDLWHRTLHVAKNIARRRASETWDETGDRSPAAFDPHPRLLHRNPKTKADMPGKSQVDKDTFRRILTRNIAFPLGMGVVTAVVFVGLILYLLAAINWVAHSERVIGDSQEIARLVSDKESAVRGYLLTGDETFLAPFETGKPKLISDINALSELVIDNPPQVDRLLRIRALQEQWDTGADRAIREHRDGQNYQSRSSAGEGRAQREESARELETFLNMEQTLRLQRVETAREITTITIVVFLAFGLSVSLLLAYLGRRELLLLSESYDAALREQAEQTEKLQQQAWLQSGQSQLGERVVGQQALTVVSRAMLEFLTQYINAPVAALYVRGEHDGFFQSASIGFSAGAGPLPRAFEKSEGLIGRAAASGRLMRLDSVPRDYWRVASALGTSVPTSLILLPLKSEGWVNGVVEIGLMRAPSEREIEFLNLIGANMGAFVETARYRERIQTALEDTQQLNEELQLQQEELRITNEELERRSVALQESKTYLSRQKAELEHINVQLSHQTLVLDEKNSALNEAQQALEERAEALQRASRYKSEFLANMSHELRTPLNSSLILSKLLAQNKPGNLSVEQVKYANTIHSAGNDLLHLINDILDLSKVEAGKMEMIKENVSLQKTLESLRLTFEPLAAHKNLAFTSRIEEGTPDVLVTDERRLEQVLKNLLSNAIKFTDSGTVDLTFARGNPGNDSVRFVVRDSGIGIASSQLESIFEAFHQADGTTSRRYGGTGLGLSISRSLATMLGGAVTVRSTPGAGSTFTLELPVDAARAKPPGAAAPSYLSAAPPETPTLAAAVSVPAELLPPHPFDDDRSLPPDGRRVVLAIEDDPTFAQILLDLAHELHYRGVVALTGGEALQLAERHAPDAILLDIGLPDRSGLVVLQELKHNAKTRHIPVHIVSAFDRTEAALHLGAVGYALKPATREALRDIFLAMDDRLRQKVKRILLVEEDATQRDVIVELVQDNDIEITAVESGHEALALLRTTPFDCMITDLKLPDMRGSDLLKQMSETDLDAFPPVIVSTERSVSPEEESELLRYSQSIIVKAARSPERLLDEVTLFLHKVESDLSEDRRAMLNATRARDRALDGRRVLLVDDDIRNIFSLSGALEHQGLAVEIGRDGFEAIATLDEFPDIDVVLMDAVMPGMDGLEATRRIRADRRFAKLPIIALTAKAMKDDQEKWLRAGASDYLAKPIDLDRLYSLLRVWMPRRDSLR